MNSGAAAVITTVHQLKAGAAQLMLRRSGFSAVSFYSSFPPLIISTYPSSAFTMTCSRFGGVSIKFSDVHRKRIESSY